MKPKNVKKVKQEVFCAISGYGLNAPNEGARDDYYYECLTPEERFEQVNNYATNVYGYILSKKAINKIVNALEYNTDWYSQLRKIPVVRQEKTEIEQERPLSGQLWENCERCGGEGPIYMSHGVCEECAK
jgi:hypothetical protein